MAPPKEYHWRVLCHTLESMKKAATDTTVLKTSKKQSLSMQLTSLPACVWCISYLSAS